MPKLNKSVIYFEVLHADDDNNADAAVPTTPKPFFFQKTNELYTQTNKQTILASWYAYNSHTKIRNISKKALY